MYYELYKNGRFIAVMKVRDIAERLGKAEPTIRNAIRKGTLVGEEYKIVKSNLTPCEIQRLKKQQTPKKKPVFITKSEIVDFKENMEPASAGKTFALPVWR